MIDNKGQVSAELILILASMSMVVLAAAYYATSYLNNITAHMQDVISEGRNLTLSKL